MSPNKPITRLAIAAIVSLLIALASVTGCKPSNPSPELFRNPPRPAGADEAANKRSGTTPEERVAHSSTVGTPGYQPAALPSGTPVGGTPTSVHSQPRVTELTDITVVDGYLSQLSRFEAKRKRSQMQYAKAVRLSTQKSSQPANWGGGGGNTISADTEKITTDFIKDEEQMVLTLYATTAPLPCKRLHSAYSDALAKDVEYQKSMLQQGKSDLTPEKIKVLVKSADAEMQALRSRYPGVHTPPFHITP